LTGLPLLPCETVLQVHEMGRLQRAIVVGRIAGMHARFICWSWVILGTRKTG
jgi:hypothetical protein